MANTNTPYIAKAAAPLTNPTTATIFTQAPNPLATIAATQATQAAYVKFECWAASNAAGTAAGVSNFQNYVPFIVRAGGRVTGATTTNFTPTLYFGRALGTNNVPGTGVTAIGSLTATAFNTASGNWYMSATLLWDPVSGQINGTYTGFAGSGGAMTNTAATAITPITGQSIAFPATSVASAFSTGDLQLFFSVGGVFSASATGNLAFLDMFEVEDI
jgi:hypothetical protein